MGKVCAFAFGWPVWVGLVIPTMITAVYTLAAGYWGVVMGDFLQGIVAIFAIVLVSLVGVYAAGGAGEIVHKLTITGQAWRLNPSRSPVSRREIFHSPGSSPCS
jgi:SSS family solute:Na+ symporter